MSRSRAILPKLPAKWETISNMGPLNKGVSEQIRQTVWINKQQNPDLEITAEMLATPVTEAAAVEHDIFFLRQNALLLRKGKYPT